MSVAIVGAGPGDPGLVTVRALELVSRCDVLVYDRLVSDELVRSTTGAERIARDGLTQDEVNELLIRHGRRGLAVVRLKGGDPFIFGRGSEEANALEAAGVEFEIVPGVSTFTAVPALAGIPLTARGVAAQVTILTGTSGDGSDLDYDHLAATPGTLVIFMGLRRVEHLAESLILAGRRFDEPAAVISRLSLPDAQVRAGTLGTLADVARGLPTPSLVLIGDVVAEARGRDALVALAQSA